MPKKLFTILIAVVFMLGASKFSFAMMCHESSSHGQAAQASAEYKHAESDTAVQATSEEAVNVGNKICPVSGEKIDEKMKATYEYEGKVYNFCCASCVEEFKKDPDKYIKKVDEELKSESEAESKEHMMMPESEMSGGM